MKRCERMMFMAFLLLLGSCGSLGERDVESGWEHGGRGSFHGGILIVSEQKAPSWCWAACIEAAATGLLGKFSFETGVTQENIVETFFRGNLLDSGVTVDDIAAAIHGRTFEHRFPYGQGLIYYTFDARVHYGMPSVEALEAWRRSGKQVIVAIPHHAVLLHEYKWEERGKETRVSELGVADPWPRRGRRTINRDAGLNQWSNDFVHAVVVVGVEERFGRG